MNKRMLKKRNDRLIYGRKIKKTLNKKIYVKPEDMPNWVWAFWWGNGEICHNGMHKEDALWYIEKGCFKGCHNFTITNLDLKVIAEIGEGPSIEISRDMKYGYVGGGYRIISLKTKRACDYGRNPDDPDEYDDSLINENNIHIYYINTDGNLQICINSKDYTYFEDGVNVLEKAKEDFCYFCPKWEFVKAQEFKRDESKTIYEILHLAEFGGDRILTYLQASTKEEAIHLFEMYSSGEPIIDIKPAKGF